MITPEGAIEGINEAFGRHRARALHAKGTLCSGTFTATPEAAALTRAAHMQGRPVEATVRLSNGSGNPSSPDYAPDVRGLATSFHLPDGSRTDISAQTSPHFPMRTPDEFIALVRANKPGLSRIWKVPLYLIRHPRVLSAVRDDARALKPPASYATRRYYGIHAYRWVGAGGDARFVRYTWLPQAQEPDLSTREAKARGRDYLQEDLRERLAKGPIRFDLQLQIAAPGDEVDDPSREWPADRETVIAGTLEVTGLSDAPDTIVFDPARVTDGIELSNDPVLRFRPRAYSISAERRS